MKTCYLHIGMNKAGSTSIQHCFRDYRDERVQYLSLAHLAPPYLDNGNHSHHLEMMFRRDVPAHFFSSPDAARQKSNECVCAGTSVGPSRRPSSPWSSPARSCLNGTTFRPKEASRLSGHTLRPCARPHLCQGAGRIHGKPHPTGYPNTRSRDRQKFGVFYPHYYQRLKSWATALGKDNFEFIPFDLVAKSLTAFSWTLRRARVWIPAGCRNRSV